MRAGGNRTPGRSRARAHVPKTGVAAGTTALSAGGARASAAPGLAGFFRAGLWALLGWLALALLASPAWAAAGDYRFDESACRFRERDWFDPARMRCGELIVREPGVAEPFVLPVLRIVGRDGRPRDQAVVFLNGGPGGRGLVEIGNWLAHPLLQRRDLILFDPRGVGLARPSLCPQLGRHVLAAVARDSDRADEAAWRNERLQACLAQLPIPVRAGLVSEQASVRDLEAIRLALGYRRLDLYGVSYGTRVAQAYAARYPAATASLVLDSPIPASGAYYQDIEPSFDRAMAAVFARCAAQAACARRYPSLAADYARLLRELAAEPLRVPLPASSTRPALRLQVNPRDLRLLLHQMLYGKEFVPVVPALIDALANRRDPSALALLFEVGVGMRADSLDFAVYYLTLAEHEPASGAEARDSGSGLAVFDTDPLLFLRVRAAGVRALAPVAQAAGTTLQAPVLVLDGGFDPIAAPAYASAVVASSAQARRVSFSATGHGVSFAEPCTQALIAGYLADPSAPLAAGCPGTAVAESFASDFVPASGLRELAQAVLLQRSLLPLAGLAAALGLYVAAASSFPLLGVLRRRSVAERSTARPLRRGALAGLAMAAGALAVWSLVLYRLATGPMPALALFGLPTAEAGWWRWSVLALAVAALALCACGLRHWRSAGTARRDRLRLALVLAGHLVLLGFLVVHGLAWPG